MIVNDLAPLVSFRKRIGSCCPVCLDDLGRNARRTLCGHMFCDSCAIAWFENHSRCPVCRTDVRRLLIELLETQLAEIRAAARPTRRAAATARYVASVQMVPSVPMVVTPVEEPRRSCFWDLIHMVMTVVLVTSLAMVAFVIVLTILGR
jgi:hypothetical protein